MRRKRLLVFVASLLVFLALLAFVLSVITWLHEVGIAISMVTLGIALVCAGAWSRRKSALLGGCILTTAPIILAPWLLTSTGWVGYRKVSVIVRVRDRSGAPVANAAVQLTNKIGSVTVSTDASGTATVVGEFQTCGTDSLLQKTAIVELLGEQLLVKAAGFREFKGRLEELVAGSCWNLYAAAPPEILVELERDGA